MRYKDIYNFKVEEEVIKAPSSVFMFDREEKEVIRVSDCDYLYMLLAIRDDTNRFLFYKEMDEDDNI